MSWLERSVEERLAQAARAGELDTPDLAGRPIADLHHQRRPGWWAEQFVRRERSRDRRLDALAEVARRRARFWRAVDESALRRAVADANERVAALNASLIDDDRLPAFDVEAVVVRWRQLAGLTSGTRSGRERVWR